MWFPIPGQTDQFDIPDEWWAFTEMASLAPRGGGYYPPPPSADFQIVSIGEVEPPKRNGGVPPFKKYKMVPVLFAFRSPEGTLPPVSYTHLRAHETPEHLVCRLLLEKKK